MRSLSAYFSALFAVLPAKWADADAGAPGAFLRQEVGARAAALSGAYGALADDASAAFWNPAGLARVVKPEFGAARAVLYEDTALDVGLAGFPVRGAGGGAAVGYLRQSTGGFERRASPLEAPTGFSITQTAFFAGFGRALPWFGVPVRAGLAAKAVRETIDTAAASSWGADLGLAADPMPRLSLALMVQNLAAPSVTFRSEAQKYPRAVDASAAYTLKAQGRFTSVAVLRAARVAEGENKIAGGLEFWQDRLAALRLGSDGDGFTTGVGVRVSNLQIDYAALLRDLGTTHQVSLRIQFGQTREELEDLIRRGIQRFTKDEAKRLAKAYVKSAEQHLEEGRYPKAVSDFEAAALWDPENPAVAKRLQEVLVQVEASVRSQIVERTALLAEQQMKRGNWVAAETHWKSVLEADPADQRAREALASLQQLQAERAEKAKPPVTVQPAVVRSEEARLAEQERAERAALQGRIDRDRREALALVRAGEDALREGRGRQEALEKASQALLLVPGLAEAQALRERAELERAKAIQRRIEEGERFTENRVFDKALASFEAALADDPKNSRALQAMAKLRSAMRPPLTQEQLKQIEKTYYLAVDAYLRGRYDEAKKQLDEIAKLDATDENARKLREKVDAALRLGTR